MTDSRQGKRPVRTVGRSRVVNNSHRVSDEYVAQPPRKTPLQARSKNTVEVILEAAARIFETRGFAKGNTNQIAELAGVSVGSLYQYYPNKRALITALHDRHVQEVGQAMAQALDSAERSDFDFIVERAVHALMQTHLRRARLQRVLHAELPCLRASNAKQRWVAQPALRLQGLLQARRPDLSGEELRRTAALALHMGEALVHAAVLNPPPGIGAGELTAGVVRALLGVLLGSAALPGCPLAVSGDASPAPTGLAPVAERGRCRPGPPASSGLG